MSAGDFIHALRGKKERPGRFARTPETADPTDAQLAERGVDDEVGILVDILSSRGELTRRELSTLAEAKTWGPRRFGRALELGVLSGRIRRTGRDRYAAGG